MKYTILLISLFTFTCSLYSPRLNDYNTELRTAFLFNATNQTFEGDIHIELNRALREEFHLKGDFLLTREQEGARLGLYPELVLYRKEGRLYDQYRTATRYELIVGARMRIVDYSPNSNSVIGVVQQSASTGYSETEGFPETELRARQRVLRMLARKLNEAAVQEWLRTYENK